MTTLHPPIYTVFVNNYTKLHGVTTQSLPEYICMHACMQFYSDVTLRTDTIILMNLSIEDSIYGKLD